MSDNNEVRVQTFWDWLVEQFHQHKHQLYEVDKIVHPHTWETYDVNKFMEFAKRTRPNENECAIYRGHLIFFMIDGSQFHYSWIAEHDGEFLYERSLRYVPSLRSLGDKLQVNKGVLTSIECAQQHSSVPEYLCGWL